MLAYFSCAEWVISNRALFFIVLGRISALEGECGSVDQLVDWWEAIPFKLGAFSLQYRQLLLWVLIS
jgi:hypothetical protein